MRLAQTALLSAVAAALPATATPTVVTEEEFLAALTDDHPAVVERSQAVAVARSRWRAASTLDNPTLALTQEDVSGPTRELQWSLSWQLPDRSRRFEVAARSAGIAAAEAALARDLSDLRSRLRQTYAEWAVSQHRGTLLREAHGRLQELASRERARADSGESSGLAAHRLSLAAATSKAELELANVATTEARAQAGALYPDLPAAAVPVVPVVPTLPEGPTRPGGEHPRLLATRAELEAAGSSRSAARRFVPSPLIVAGWKRQESELSEESGAILGLSWSLPLFGRKQAERVLADAQETAAKARLESARRELRNERRAAQDSYQQLAIAVAEATAATRDNARMIAAAEASFRHGEASLTDLLEILRGATESELAVLDLQAAALAAHRELERLSASVTRDAASRIQDPPSPQATVNEPAPKEPRP